MVKANDDKSAGEMLTVQDVAGILKVSDDHVYKLVREGRIPAVRLGRIYRFNAETIARLKRGDLDEKGRVKTPPPKRIADLIDENSRILKG
jgi:excisionase family DNA binding protein